MKFTWSWLKEHLDTKAGVGTIADTLTRIGLEVEQLFDPAKSLAPFRVAEVVKWIPAKSASRWCAARRMRGPE